LKKHNFVPLAFALLLEKSFALSPCRLFARQCIPTPFPALALGFASGPTSARVLMAGLVMVTWCTPHRLVQSTFLPFKVCGAFAPLSVFCFSFLWLFGALFVVARAATIFPT